MLVYESQTLMTVGEAPIGLLRVMATDTLILKTEYKTDDGLNCLCYIVRTGENFCSGDNTQVVPVIID